MSISFEWFGRDRWSKDVNLPATLFAHLFATWQLHPFSTMSQVFPVDRSLLNPKFDGYRLKGSVEQYTQSLHALPAPGATQSTISSRATKAPLSFEEVQSRIKHNHLAISYIPGEFAYVDAGRKLVIISINQASPSSHSLERRLT